MGNETGGPAFPIFKPDTTKVQGDPNFVEEYYTGMTMLDYFAGQVIQGMVAAMLPNDNWDYTVYAGQAYEQAEAMVESGRALKQAMIDDAEIAAENERKESSSAKKGKREGYRQDVVDSYLLAEPSQLLEAVKYIRERRGSSLMDAKHEAEERRDALWALQPLKKRRRKA
jgi:hypothetical protein